jgi:hypothetical protein
MEDPLPSEPGVGSFHAIPNADKLSDQTPAIKAIDDARKALETTVTVNPQPTEQQP